jgi:capsular polysaccharide transport system permease protein
MTILRVAEGVQSPLFQSIRVQLRIIRALIIREIIGRYGKENFGFFWVIGEPMLLCFGVMVLWSITGQSHGGSVPVIPFALTGYSHIQLWRLCVFGASHSIRRSAWLSYHPNVHTFDVLVAKAMMPAIGIFGAFLLAYGTLYVLNMIAAVEDPLLVTVAWVLDAFFCFSAALVLAGLSELSELFERLLHPIMYLTMPLTGTFVMAGWLPPKARDVVGWSPLANACEMLRAGVLGDTVPTYWNAWYILLCSLVLMALGLPLMTYAKRNVEIH